MTRWPLRWKLALWTAFVASVALLAGSVGVGWFLRHNEIAALDRRLDVSARELFRDLENFEGGPMHNRTEVTEKFVPLALRPRLIELCGRHDEPIYRSANLGGDTLHDSIKGFHTRAVAGRTVRIGVFRHEDLTLHVGADLAEIDVLTRKFELACAVAAPAVAVIILCGALWGGRRALRPVEAITKAAEQISARRLDQRLPVPSARDEIGALVTVLNATFDRLQRSFEQAIRFSADASHQLKTPVTVLRLGLEEILNDPSTPPRQRETVSDLLHQTHRLTSVTEDLLLLARADAGRIELRREPMDLRALLDGWVDDARALGEPHELDISADLPAHLPVVADERRVGLIVQNMVENAVKYNRAGGRIRIAARIDASGCALTIGNTGATIPPDRTEHVFERFFRARGDERAPGLGLGLSIARELARAHGGELALVRSADDWTEFQLRLPCV